MKLTKTQLRQIIREEVQKLNEKKSAKKRRLGKLRALNIKISQKD